MQTIGYKDKRVKYNYMLLLSSLGIGIAIYQLIIRLAAATNSYPSIILFYVFLFMPYVVTLFLAIAGLREKVAFRDAAVVNSKLFDRVIKYASIRSISVCKGADMCYQIVANHSKPLVWKLSYYESDEDIQAFRDGLAELIRQARQANPAVKVDDHCSLMRDGSTAYAAQQAQYATEKRAALKGLGGWLAWLIFDIATGCISSTQAAINGFSQPNSIPFPLGLIPISLYVAELALNVVAFVFLIKRSMRFQKVFLALQVYVPVRYVIVTSITLLSAGNGIGLVDILFKFLLPVAYNITWVFVWREYFARSIRVKNTLTR